MLRLLKKTQIKQLTKKWYNIRHNLITASECGSALEANPFQKKIDLLKKNVHLFKLILISIQQFIGVKNMNMLLLIFIKKLKM